MGLAGPREAGERLGLDLGVYLALNPGAVLLEVLERVTNLHQADKGW